MSELFIGCPTYDGRVHIGTAQAVYNCSSRYQKHIAFRKSSLLGDAFNSLWCMALNLREKGITHFAMMHSDILPQNNWADILMDEMNANECKVISCNVPICDTRGLSSSAWGTAEKGAMVNISMADLKHMPKTFTSAFSKNGRILLINTGLWLADIRENWVEKVSFQIDSWIEKMPDGKFGHGVLSEDWRFAMILHDLGVPYCATSTVKLQHCGDTLYSNEQVVHAVTASV